MVMGQEERKNKAKLEKTQISVATSNSEYEHAVKALEDTTARWNREWKAAADKFQDLEEERLDFTKSSLWQFANIASTLYSKETPTLLSDRATNSPEPIDANASLALNVGQNVFSVTTPDMERRAANKPKAAPEETDPIALALAELKGAGADKQSTVRVSADRYHGIATPAPSTQQPFSRSIPPLAGGGTAAAGLRGTPPPSYDQQVQRLGVPPAAVTARAMKETSQKFTDQARTVFGSDGRPDSSTSRATGRGREVPRAMSPAPPRSVSPRPDVPSGMRSGHRSASPNPRAAVQHDSGIGQPRSQDQDYYRQGSPNDMARTASPAPFREYTRSNSGPAQVDMAIQLAPFVDENYGSQRGRGGGGRPGTSSSNKAMGLYDGGGPAQSGSRQRSKSVADPSRQYTRDGRAILHFARAMYMYQAAIPEELGFSKGDMMAVLRHQDDGWWEAEESLDRAYRAATSKGAQRAAINLSLLLGGCIPLLFIATISTTLFYRSYMPDQVTASPVYLQYGSGLNPFGFATFENTNLKTQQAYDINVVLKMPRSPPNLERGNFMIVVYLLNGDIASVSSTEPQRNAEGRVQFDERSIMFESRRSALVPYRDPWVNVASRFVFLLYHLILPESQVMTLSVPMARKILLASQQSGMPTAAYLEIQAGQGLQTYETSIVMTAQLHGLRWAMYHYRLPTFIAATVLFWAAEVAFMMVAWLAWGSSMADSLSPSPHPEVKADGARVTVKTEEGEFDEFSDVPRTFPTSSKQPPLKYEPHGSERSLGVKSLHHTTTEIEADDEAEEDMREGWRGDSGIGTSYSEAGTGSGGKIIRRRSSNHRKA
ncbi:hypothetical protein ACHAQH_009224 [Verticillium albo-atrum]